MHSFRPHLDGLQRCADRIILFLTTTKICTRYTKFGMVSVYNIIFVI